MPLAEDAQILVSCLLPGPPPPPWPARWVTHPAAGRQHSDVLHFRCTLTLDAVPARLPVRVSADNRYQLFVNGTFASEGPPRGDVPHWRYDRVDLAPHLRPGRNVLAVVVWFITPDIAAWAQMGNAPGFLVCCEHGNDHAELNTPGGWMAFRNSAIEFQDGRVAGHVTGPGERVEASAYPWGWEQPEFNDGGWVLPVAMEHANERGAEDGPSPWMLVPNLLPPMERTSEPLVAVVRAEGKIVENHRLAPDAPIVIKPGHQVTLLFDRGHLTTAYPELTVEGGAGAGISLRYGEALFDTHGHKGNRDEIEGRHVQGHNDNFLPDGPRRTYRPLVWRTFRYLQIEVRTSAEPLTLHSLNTIFSAYPFEQKGRIAASDESLAKLWEVGWRTARLCAHETYMDCPYYEQLQYGGDTRIQCLISYYVAGDSRLARNAIAQLDDSRLPDGITQSRYPCHVRQIIPPFALWWIGMIHDYWMFVDDPLFVRALLPGIRTVLVWYLAHLNGEGLLGPLPWWNFADWAPEFPRGVPPGVVEGGSTIFSLQLVMALREASEMEQAFGQAESARNYRAQAKRIAEAVRKHCWDDFHNMLADTPAKEKFSQHANALGILTDVFEKPEAAAAAEKMLVDTKGRMAHATFYFQHYLHRALCKAGLGDHYLEWLAPWRKMVALGLSTYAETPEPTRSDCHAWSAHPNAGLLSTVLGIEPAAPGFAKVNIWPHLGDLLWVEGVVPHPRGEIFARFEREAGVLHAHIRLPEGVSGTLYQSDRSRTLRAGPQTIAI
jgi:hypothetical protein